MSEEKKVTEEEEQEEETQQLFVLFQESQGGTCIGITQKNIYEAWLYNQAKLVVFDPKGLNFTPQYKMDPRTNMPAVDRNTGQPQVIGYAMEELLIQILVPSCFLQARLPKISRWLEIHSTT